MRRALAVGCLSVLFCKFSPASAELVYFTRGGQAQLPATVEGDEVRLDTPDGPRIFSRSDFLAIIPGSVPSREWISRRAAAVKEDNAEREILGVLVGASERPDFRCRCVSR